MSSAAGAGPKPEERLRSRRELQAVLAALQLKHAPRPGTSNPDLL